VYEHPNAEIAGICDADTAYASRHCQLQYPGDKVFTDVDACMQATQPDVVLLCAGTALHADYVEMLAPYGVNILVEKPFAATLAQADRMIAAMTKSGKQMIVNWPLAWYPPHLTAKRLIDEGVIGKVMEVHYYDGNRGPLHHVQINSKYRRRSRSPEKFGVVVQKRSRWWLDARLPWLWRDLGTWYHGGDKPLEVTAVVDEPFGIEVDEHSITIARYAKGLSKFETRWVPLLTRGHINHNPNVVL
jgi:glucose-fructose oxidoreductase